MSETIERVRAAVANSPAGLLWVSKDDMVALLRAIDERDAGVDYLLQWAREQQNVYAQSPDVVAMFGEVVERAATLRGDGAILINELEEFCRHNELAAAALRRCVEWSEFLNDGNNRFFCLRCRVEKPYHSETCPVKHALRDEAGAAFAAELKRVMEESEVRYRALVQARATLKLADEAPDAFDHQQADTTFRIIAEATGDAPPTPRDERDPATWTDRELAGVLLSQLWLIYDGGGISDGRSYEAVLLEAAREVLQLPVPKIDVTERPRDKVLLGDVTRRRLARLGLEEAKR